MRIHSRLLVSRRTTSSEGSGMHTVDRPMSWLATLVLATAAIAVAVLALVLGVTIALIIGVLLLVGVLAAIILIFWRRLHRP
jgi:hypothetical protein